EDTHDDSEPLLQLIENGEEEPDDNGAAEEESPEPLDPDDGSQSPA
ncbi:MAG: hypothetical protein JKY68_02870, partial [Rhodospirillales bacterium]|nr:hypothetical protein [Rhodospirillales bacterium]